MDLKFYLNKFLKVDRIEDYTLESLFTLKKTYDELLEKTEGVDPDFPMIDFGSKGTTIKGKNKVQVLGENGNDEPFDIFDF
jgi:hypothetical protein